MPENKTVKINSVKKGKDAKRNLRWMKTLPRSGKHLVQRSSPALHFHIALDLALLLSDGNEVLQGCHMVAFFLQPREWIQ